MHWKPAVWWIWPVATAFLLALQLWFPDSGTGLQHDTWSHTAEGQLAFYRLVEDYAAWTDRNTRPLTTSLKNGSIEPTLCILGPERWPTTKEWEAILEWVHDGGHLVFACRGAEEQTIPRLDIRYEPRFSSDPPDDSLPPETELTASPAIAWWTDGQLMAPGRTVLVRYDDTVQAVAGEYGLGRFVVTATGLVFSNQLLSYGDNSVLALRLLESTSDLEGVTFDESLNSTGTPKAVGLLFDREFRPLTLQLILITVLYGWWNFRRFGPLLRSAVGRRQNIVDHTDALGVAYWRSRDGVILLRSYWQQFQREFHLQDKHQTDPRWSVISERLGKTRPELQTWFTEVQALSERPRLARRRAAEVIRRLAQIRHWMHESSLSPRSR